MDLEQRILAFMTEIWNAGDFTHLKELVSPAYEIFDDPGDPWNGQTLDHPAFVRRVAYSRNAFPDLHFDVRETVQGDQKVAIRWIMSGTHLGDLPQLPATDKPFRISGMTFYYFTDDKVSGHRQAFDQLGFLTQIQALGRLTNP